MTAAHRDSQNRAAQAMTSWVMGLAVATSVAAAAVLAMAAGSSAGLMGKSTEPPRLPPPIQRPG